MAITRTATTTATYARTELVKMQIERILRRSAVDRNTITRILLGVDNGWISELSIYGLDDSGWCHAELFIRIDWNRNALHISAGRDTVQIDAGWEGGIATEVDLALEKFDMFARRLGLRKTFHVRYTPGYDVDTINQRLGFSRARPVRWRDGTVGTVMSIPELDEVTVGINVAGGF